MENTEILYFTLGAVSLMVGMLAYGPMKQLWYVIKHSISHRKNIKVDMLANTNKIELGILKQQVNDLQTQVDNLAEKLATRDHNRKSNIRRDVRDYLAELQTK